MRQISVMVVRVSDRSALGIGGRKQTADAAVCKSSSLRPAALSLADAGQIRQRVIRIFGH